MKKFKADRFESMSRENSLEDLEQFEFMNRRCEDFENNDLNPKNIERLLEEM